MAEAVNRQILLVEKPTGKLALTNFKLVTAKVPEPNDGEVLVRTRYISLDAANRAWMQGATYRSAVEANTVMAGGSISEVMASKAPGFANGDLVFADTGWQDFAALPAKALTKVPRMEPMTHLLSVFASLAHRLFRACSLRPAAVGRDRVVSAAAAVGSIVGQIAKIQGCTVIGIAGGKRMRVAYQRTRLLMPRSTTKPSRCSRRCAPRAEGRRRLFRQCRRRYLRSVLPQMNIRGRIACCGAVSAYDGAPPAHGPRGVPGLFVVKRLTVQGFLVSDFYGERDHALADLQGWVKSGKLKVQEDIIDGLENTHRALIGLLAGDNRGKRMVKV